jgi:hypothetical protein
MTIAPPFLASGDAVLYGLLAGVLLLAGGTLGLGVAGIVFLFGKTEERKRVGRRLLLAAAVLLAVAAVWWISVVGWD